MRDEKEAGQKEAQTVKRGTGGGARDVVHPRPHPAPARAKAAISDVALEQSLPTDFEPNAADIAFEEVGVYVEGRAGEPA